MGYHTISLKIAPGKWQHYRALADKHHGGLPFLRHLELLSSFKNNDRPTWAEDEIMDDLLNVVPSHQLLSFVCVSLQIFASQD
jgi:hypothetical protein